MSFYVQCHCLSVCWLRQRIASSLCVYHIWAFPKLLTLPDWDEVHRLHGTIQHIAGSWSHPNDSPSPPLHFLFIESALDNELGCAWQSRLFLLKMWLTTLLCCSYDESSMGFYLKMIRSGQCLGAVAVGDSLLRVWYELVLTQMILFHNYPTWSQALQTCLLPGFSWASS